MDGQAPPATHGPAAPGQQPCGGVDRTAPGRQDHAGPRGHPRPPRRLRGSGTAERPRQDQRRRTILRGKRRQPGLGRRLVKAPKVYVRDSGICHALLGIETVDDLFGHPVVGGSWEGFVIENIASTLPSRASCGYYRTAGGAEVDLVVDLGAGELWAMEIKSSSAPKVSRGFHNACEDLRPARRFVVHAGDESFPLAKDIRAVTLPAMMELVARSR